VNNFVTATYILNDSVMAAGGAVATSHEMITNFLPDGWQWLRCLLDLSIFGGVCDL